MHIYAEKSVWQFTDRYCHLRVPAYLLVQGIWEDREGISDCGNPTQRWAHGEGPGWKSWEVMGGMAPRISSRFFRGSGVRVWVWAVVNCFFPVNGSVLFRKMRTLAEVTTYLAVLTGAVLMVKEMIIPGQWLHTSSVQVGQVTLSPRHRAGSVSSWISREGEYLPSILLRPCLLLIT